MIIRSFEALKPEFWLGDNAAGGYSTLWQKHVLLLTTPSLCY
jgi:hypothetical protein